MWCSVLDWGGQYVPITAEVQETKVTLSHYLITIDELYVGVQHTVSVTVNNLTCLPTAVSWGIPVAQSNDKITIEVNPSCAFLEAWQKLHTDVHIIPHATVKSSFNYYNI